ncbi:MAG: AhpC/TSA family protein [Acidimicrobiales bacterium]
MLCREHASQLRDAYPQISEAGAEVVAIGTGDARYAKAFVADVQAPYYVLVDDDAAAASAAAVKKVNFATLLFDPRSLKGARRAHRDGFRVTKSGKRVNQLGATFVIGPGSQVRYAHVDAHTADHAPLSEVLAALPA